MKGCKTSFLVWKRGLKICLASETVGMRLYHPLANCITLDEFHAFQKPNPIYTCGSPYFTAIFLENNSLP